MLFLVLLAVAAAAAIVGTLTLVHSDGYGRRPHRDDRTANPKRLL